MKRANNKLFTGGTLTLQDIAHELHVHVRTIQRWIERGQFPRPTIAIRRTLRWTRDDITAFLEQSQQEHRN